MSYLVIVGLQSRRFSHAAFRPDENARDTALQSIRDGIATLFGIDDSKNRDGAGGASSARG
ncbi:MULTISPECIES: hypothetical protein [Paraburkholderia]|uniref:Uncharacterized protein n=1 Tax=Paraburkholderia podalyriae TaxID=1938811 RepID=A0ABR7PQ76_9BURK|nr:hypothetical protein [Paraburkholderia podalyriae]MBC8748398.1 hypothetical protein [Paraburkholderia podalyriae]